MKRTRVFILFVMVAMFISLASFSFAAENAEEVVENILIIEDDDYSQPPLSRSIPIVITARFIRNTPTKATTTVKYNFNRIVDILKSTIVLQVYTSGRFVDTASPAKVNARSVSTATHKAVFAILAGKKYRAKITVKATDNGTTTSETDYQDLS